MPKTTTHNAILLRPFPGGRFSIHGSDVELQFQRGHERQMYNWLHDWLEAYVLPEVVRAEQGPVVENPEVAALQARIRAEGSPGTRAVPATHNTGGDKLQAMSVKATHNHVQYNAQPGGPGWGVGVTRPNQFMQQKAAHAGNAPLVPAGQVVYGPNGPMSAEEIQSLPEKPIPGVGYVSPSAPLAPSVPTTDGASGDGEGHQ